MPYLRAGKEKHRKHVPIEETRCWFCARLKHRTNGNFACPKNQLLPKNLPCDFAAKCTSYIEFISKHQEEDVNRKKKSLRDTEISQDENKRQTVFRDEQIRVLLAKGLVEKYRGRVGTPREVEIWRQEGFERKRSIEEHLTKRPKESERVSRRPPNEHPDIISPRKDVSRIPEARPIWAKYMRPLEGRNLFSINEMQIEGYCEECSNYGALRYTNGLYLCVTCRDLTPN